MDYRLRITDLALEDLDAIVSETARRGNPAVASEWLDGFARALALLYAGAGEPAPEASETDFLPRQIVYRSHRVLFEVDEAEVHVLRVYRAVGKSLTLNLLPR